MNNSWLPLTDYSTKYRVSVSTLRRKIKADDINYRFADGKYFIMDDPSEQRSDQRPEQSAAGLHRPSQVSLEVQSADAEQNQSSNQSFQVNASGNTPVNTQLNNQTQNISEKLNRNAFPLLQKDEPVLTAANRLLGELKKAYTLILQEKEEQILNLHEEITDLKTLVRVLESENERLVRRTQF